MYCCLNCQSLEWSANGTSSSSCGNDDIYSYVNY